MSFQDNPAVWTDREPTLDEELRAMGEEDIFDMANLVEAQTGIPGIVTITTVIGKDGLRLKYLLKPGRHQPSFSVAVASTPRVVANSLDERDLRRVADKVIEWVALNHEALAAFWWDGADWTAPDVQTFIAGLKKV